MNLRLGYYGDQRAELLDLVWQTCHMLGGSLIIIDSGAVPSIDILLWYVVPPLDNETHAWLHQSFNVYLLCERWENPQKRYTAGVAPEAFYEEYLVIPFDPEELALRIVAASFRRGHVFQYAFDPTFYATHRAFLDRSTGLAAPSLDGAASS